MIRKLVDWCRCHALVSLHLVLSTALRNRLTSITILLPLRSQKYLECLKEEKQQHHKCRELSKEYLQCRMDNELMAKENLDEMGYSEETRITEAKEYDKSKEKEGYVAGKHIKGKLTGWLW